MGEKFETRHRLIAGLCVVVVTLVLVGCGSRTASPPLGSPDSSAAGCPQVQNVSFDKTKFVLHAGLGFGAFHHCSRSLPTRSSQRNNSPIPREQ